MRRVTIVCALMVCTGLSIFSAPAFGAVLDGPRRPAPDASGTAVAQAAARNGHGISSPRTGGMLFGVRTLGRSRHYLPAGVAQAFAFESPHSGTVRSLMAYVDAGSAAKRLQAGLYSAQHGQPGTLLTSGSVSSVSAGRWVRIGVSAMPVRSRATYWLALLSSGGPLVLRGSAPALCSVSNPPHMSVRSLPRTWLGRHARQACFVSAYASASGRPTAPSGTVHAPNSPVNGPATFSTTPSDPSGSDTDPPSGTSAPSASPPVPSLLPPVNVLPSTVTGSPVAGQTLTTSDGTWLDSPSSFSYQWQDCNAAGANCAAIDDATSPSYTLQTADVGHTVRSLVIASNSAGSNSASSSATGPVTLPPPPTAAFTYSPPTPVTGQPVSFDGSLSSCAYTPCTYSWADDPPSGGSWPFGSGQRIGFTFSATGTKYVTLTATDAAGRTASAEHDVVVTSGGGGSPAPQNTSLPQITGIAQQGQTLSVSNGSWSGSPTSYAYQWQDCDTSGANCSNVSGATSSSYALVAGDVGHTIRAAVTGSNTSGSTPTTSSQTGVVTSSGGGGGSAPSNTALPTITGTATQGSAVSTANGSWTGSPTSFTYAWQDCDSSGANCSNIGGATASNYTLAGADLGHTIRSVVTAHNANGATPASSAATAVVASSGSTSCNVNATTSNFSSQVAAASAGQTVCLASGNYGTWSGVNKAITITAASGASPQMVIQFSSGDGGFTLDHIANLSGTIFGGSNITIQNSTFSSGSCTIGCLDIEGSMSNVVINHDTFSYAFQSSSSGPNSKLFLDTSGSSPGAAVTIENSYFANGDLDGIHFGGGSGDLVENNFFTNLCDRNVNHTDNMQFEGGSQIAIVGNYIYSPGPTSSSGCVAGGIDSYDGGTNGLLIENNVVDTTRDWGIELYSDKNSTVEHNTVVYHPKSYSAFNSGDGQIDIDRKSQDPAGTGTHAYDNVGTVDFTNGSTGTADHNTDPSTVSYASACSSGCTYGSATVHDEYLLAAGSPGVGAANDGSNDGIYAAGW